MDPVTLKEARKGIGRSGGYVRVTPEGQVVAESAINPNWEKWQDRLHYNYRTSSPPTTTPMYNEFKGTVATDSMFFVRGGKGRWGFHVFEGYGAEDDIRLTMLAGRFPEVASIYYFKPSLPDEGVPIADHYKWLQLGTDEPNKGIFVSHELTRVYTPLEFGVTSAIRRTINTSDIEITGGSQTGPGQRNGGALRLFGGDRLNAAGAVEVFIGDYTKDIPNTHFAVNHMSDGKITELLRINANTGSTIFGGAIVLARLPEPPPINIGGAMYYDTTLGKPRVNVNGTWRNIVYE